jgi:hypothetical protein
MANMGTPDIVVTGFPAFAKAITPNDGDVLRDANGKDTAQFVYVGTVGDVKVIPAGMSLGDTPVTFTVPAGGMVPVKCRKVYSTGTSASGLIGIY